MADVNGDGKPDILVVADMGSPSKSGLIGVLLGNGDGTFQPVRLYATKGYGVAGIAVADVNGDARPDLLVAQHDGVAVLSGNGDGTFRAAIKYLISGTEGLAAIAAADLNGDGHTDLVVAESCLPGSSFCDVAGVGVLLGNGDGTFGSAHSQSSGGIFPSSIVAADLNHDGKIDVAVFNGAYVFVPNEQGSVGVLLGNGDGSFEPVRSYLTGGFDGGFGGNIAVADLNRDGNLDIVAANNCVNQCASAGVGVLLGNGDGSFQDVKLKTGTGGAYPVAVAVADINLDGIPDLLVANLCKDKSCLGDGTVGLLLGNGDGTFSLSTTNYDAGGSSNFIAIADVNGDGTPDVFVSTGGPVGVLLTLFDATTSLSSSSSQSVYGQLVTLTAEVESNGPILPSGSVVFYNGEKAFGSAIVSRNQATLATIHLPAGTLSLSAVYKGDELTLRSTSQAINLTVTQAATNTTITSSVNPSVQGQLVKFTATVSSPTTPVTGTVTFTSGTTTLGTVSVSGGKATFSTSTLPPGRDNITASYNGTSNISGSMASLTQTVN